MTIEEIKKKYEEESRTQKRAIEAAERKRDLQRAWVEQLIAERKELTPSMGLVDYDTRQRINHLTFKINEAKAKLSKLETECRKARTGDTVKDIVNIIEP
jgi:chromosome segregation ATPase